jgi:hypothetical protein
LPSCAHVTAVEPEQMLPVDVQIELLHVHTPEPVQLWFESVQAAAVPHVPPDEQVSTFGPEHWVAFGLHATQPPFRQTGVRPEHVVVDAV